MDSHNFTHEGQTGYLTDQKESHWQPALRPNDDETIDQQNITTIQVSRERFSHDDSDDEMDVQRASGGLDPAWGIKRTDSAAILESVIRSPSFPPPEVQEQHTFFPPTQSTDMIRSPAIMDADDEKEPLISADKGVSPSFAQEIEGQQTLENEQTSRWEEGVPLINAQETAIGDVLAQESQVSHVVENGTFEAEGDSADATFFAQISSSDEQQQPIMESQPILERKETSDVLDGLGFQNTIPDSPVRPVAEAGISQRSTTIEKDISAAFADSTTDDADFAAAFGQPATQDDPWAAALGDDEDEFLVEDADDLLPDSDEEVDAVPAQMSAPAVSQQPARQTRTNSNLYAPHQPSTSELTGFGSIAQVGLSRASQNPMGAFQTPQQNAIVNRAESFADQAKGGYKSPYDLPMDLAPKKKVQTQRVQAPTALPPPPPRSSSITTDKQLQSPFSPHPPTFNRAAVASPHMDRAASVPVKAAPTVNKRPNSGFFEELPIAPRSRPAPVPQRASVAQTPAGPPRQASMTNAPPVLSPPQIQQPSQQQADPYAQFDLQQPPRLDPYANVPLQPVQPALTPAAPPVQSRYSPAPASVPNGIKPTPSPRYSPAPPPQMAGARYSPAPPSQPATHNRYVSQPLPAANLPHQPRTSSPLAQHRRSVDDAAEKSQGPRPVLHHTTSSSLPYTASFAPGPATLSPPQSMDPTKQEIVPPRRSQTQSPSRQMARPGIPSRIVAPPNRPASAFGQLSPTRTEASQNVLSPPRAPLPVQSLLSPPRAPAPTQSRQVEEFEYIQPTDETVHDPLQRWKGAPIFRFGFGGNVVKSFPVKVPRYSSASIRPQMKISSGEVRIQKLDSSTTLSEIAVKFPGPLKGKAKKKDVLAWLTTSIGDFERTIMTQPSRQLDEKILLWKIVKVLVETDGNLDAAQAVQNISSILMPEIYSSEIQSASQSAGDEVTMGIYRPATFNAKAEAVDPIAVEKLRATLLKGKRTDAVWQAVDNRLWSHALILASTLDKSVWKQVVAEFVKQEVKTIGASSDSLCAFYEVLGGNLEESIDQLVPPSARAGLQMVSKVESSGPTRNALDGLDRWKETLCLIINNRSFEDQRAMITLARLLSDYGRVEAAHICYLLARSAALPNVVGPADDPNTMMVLLGADHRHFPSTFQNDQHAVLLTEIYEFAISTLAAGSTGASLPHLAVFKLARANELADAGMKSEAQAYCDAVTAGLGSKTKSSLYYNPLLLNEVEVLSNRLKQIPVQSASWLAKPSIEKVSGSLLNKFSSFITGEDSDAESKASARDAAEAGPFANVTGSPGLSRNNSQTDLYGSYPTQMQMTPVVAATSAGSRYAPNGMNSTRSSSELTRGRTSLDYQRSPPSTSHSNETRGLYAPVQSPHQSQYSPSTMSPPTSAYQPISSFQPSPEPPMPSVAEEPTVPHQTYSSEVYTPNMNGIQQQTPSFGGYTPSPVISQPEQEGAMVPESDLNQTQNTFEPSAEGSGYGYQPPDDSGYVPYEPEPDSDDEKPKSKPRRSFMDEGDDNYSSVARDRSPAGPTASAGGDEAAEKARKKANDEAAEAAFRAAAEADAQAAKERTSKKQSGSWLGGWFGGAKKPDSLDAAPASKGGDSKVHRVHLGESKMKLYYDKDKKKWINPDNPEASEKKATPPPPRSSSGSVPPMGPPTGPPMGPPRSVSAAMSLPPSGLSRSGTPASVAIDTASEGGESRPGTSGGPPSGLAATLPPGTQQSLGLGSTPLPTPPGSSGGLAPPSRPASALSSASGLDDLLGGPPTAGARKVSGRTAKGKKGRYVDVMAK